ncbi:MAG: hypothetical protein K2X47_17175 [Bdellovibrionales bacterium]|nr:hypothetical protein [Bdellovibrionales bacterium]
MKRTLNLLLTVFFGITGTGQLGLGAEKDEFTWMNQQLECVGPASRLTIQMNPLKPFGRMTHNYETGSVVCNFDTRSPEFQCVGFWNFAKDLIQISLKQNRNGKAVIVASTKASSVYKSRPIQLSCSVKAQVKNAGRESLQQ